MGKQILVTVFSFLLATLACAGERLELGPGLYLRLPSQKWKFRSGQGAYKGIAVIVPRSEPGPSVMALQSAKDSIVSRRKTYDLAAEDHCAAVRKTLGVSARVELVRNARKVPICRSTAESNGQTQVLYHLISWNARTGMRHGYVHAALSLEVPTQTFKTHARFLRELEGAIYALR